MGLYKGFLIFQKTYFSFLVFFLFCHADLKITKVDLSLQNSTKLYGYKKIDLKKGDNKISLTNLPFFCTKKNILFSGFSDSVFLKKVAITTALFKEKLKPNLKKLKQLDFSIKLIEKKIELCDFEVSYYKQILDSYIIAIRESNIDIEKPILEFPSSSINSFRDKSLENLEKKSSLSKQLETLLEKRKQINSKLTKLRNKAHQQKNVTLFINSNSDIENFTLNFTLETYDKVRAQLEYDFFIFPKTKKIKIRSYVSVQQNSLFDWQDVTLLVNNQDYSQSFTYPTSQVLRFKNSSYKLKKSSSFYSRDKEEDSNSEEKFLKKITYDQYNLNYKLPETYTIKNGSQRKLFLKEFGFEANFYNLITPTDSLNAFLYVETINNTSLPFAKNSLVRLYLDNNYLKFLYLTKTILPKEKFKQKIQINPLLKVTYKTLKEEEGEIGFLSSSKIEKYNYEVKVKNFSSFNQRVYIYDRFPISKNQAIIVKTIAPKKKELITEDKFKGTGIFAIERDIKSQAQAVVNIKYELHYPQDKKLDR